MEWVETGYILCLQFLECQLLFCVIIRLIPWGCLSAKSFPGRSLTYLGDCPDNMSCQTTEHIGTHPNVHINAIFVYSKCKLHNAILKPFKPLTVDFGACTSKFGSSARTVID